MFFLLLSPLDQMTFMPEAIPGTPTAGVTQCPLSI
jgi:hypothetical protein